MPKYEIEATFRKRKHGGFIKIDQDTYIPARRKKTKKPRYSLKIKKIRKKKRFL